MVVVAPHEHVLVFAAEPSETLQLASAVERQKLSAA